MSTYDGWNGMFLFSLICVKCPPTLRHGSAWFEITQELQPQTRWSLQTCIHGISSDVSVEMWVWKLSQDVYTAAFDECLLVCQRAACLTSKSWLLHSSPVCSSDITHVTVYCLCCRFRSRNSGRIPVLMHAEDAPHGSHLNIYITGTVLQHTDSTKLLGILAIQFQD